MSNQIPPLQPQPIEQMRARYPEALKRTFQYGEKGDQWPARGPWEYPDQRFDFEDGLRLMVSRDAFGKKVELHISASILPNTSLWRQFEHRDNFGSGSQAILRVLAEDRYRLISDDRAPFPFNGFTSRAKGFKGVPHWRRPE